MIVKIKETRKCMACRSRWIVSATAVIHGAQDIGRGRVFLSVNCHNCGSPTTVIEDRRPQNLIGKRR